MAKKKKGKGKGKKGQSRSGSSTTANNSKTEVTQKAQDPKDMLTTDTTAAPEVSSVPSGDLPEGLEASMSLFTPKQQILLKLLCSARLGQAHLFDTWSATATEDDVTNTNKRQLAAQLEALHASYPSGGLAGYVQNARTLLDKSRKGQNPLEGWEPTVPTGQAFDIGTKEYAQVEALGLKELGSVGFVLVAGGLGERLGYGDIKIGLPTELATETKYLQYYVEYILALQIKYAPAGRKLPLCIMVSGDTNAGTIQLLKENDNFGMDDDQITIVQQGQGVPALVDNDAKMALESEYKILTKPHGHGDVHALLYSEHVATKWGEQGVQWIAFFQDTNGLAFHTLPLALGVSTKFDLVMNSLAVPRKAKQAIGGIAKLVNDKGETRTINVEYNQLDPLLRASGHDDGDVNDPETGMSPYPGNINQLLFKLEPYMAALERTKGAMPEFVNPKYKDAEKTIFKKPTRLECMMQDFPTVLQGKEAEKVGFTSVAAELCFSPVKNATADGAALQAKGSPPGVAASGEADQYGAIRSILRSLGCKVKDAAPATFSGVSIIPGPQIVFKPDFVTCPADYKTAFPFPDKISISPRSSLVVKGSNIVIESLQLDGALVIECEEGANGVIGDLVVTNKGWTLTSSEKSDDEVIAMRGYTLQKGETRSILFKKDGSIEGDYDPNPMNTPSTPSGHLGGEPPVATMNASTKDASEAVEDAPVPSAAQGLPPSDAPKATNTGAETIPSIDEPHEVIAPEKIPASTSDRENLATPERESKGIAPTSPTKSALSDEPAVTAKSLQTTWKDISVEAPPAASPAKASLPPAPVTPKRPPTLTQPASEEKSEAKTQLDDVNCGCLIL